jgi:hypothetical protein
MVRHFLIHELHIGMYSGSRPSFQNSLSPQTKPRLTRATHKPYEYDRLDDLLCFTKKLSMPIGSQCISIGRLVEVSRMYTVPAHQNRKDQEVSLRFEDNSAGRLCTSMVYRSKKQLSSTVLVLELETRLRNSATLLPLCTSYHTSRTRHRRGYVTHDRCF